MAENEASWEPVCPFWIDTPSYSRRDREMFVAGYEFCQTLEKIRHSEGEYRTTIHRENESRVRMACGRFGRVCQIIQCEQEHDPDGTWSYLTIQEKDGRTDPASETERD